MCIGQSEYLLAFSLKRYFIRQCSINSSSRCRVAFALFWHVVVIFKDYKFHFNFGKVGSVYLVLICGVYDLWLVAQII